MSAKTMELDPPAAVDGPMSEPLAFTSPCDADLDAMPSFDGGRRRFCSACTKSVHMLSEMTREQARAFVHDNPDACMSYRRGADGRLVFRDAPLGFVPRARLSPRARPALPARTAALAAAPMLALLHACGGPVVVADELEDERAAFMVESEAYAAYSAVPEQVPCDPPPEPEPEPETRPRKKPNNEALINGQLPPIGNPGLYAGGISAHLIDGDDPFGDGISGGPGLASLELGATTVEGAEEAAVRRVLRRGVSSLRGCLEREGIDASAGELQLRFVIDATGRVLKSSASLTSGQPASCVSEQIADWSFPEPEAPSATVEVRFSLG